MPLRSAIELRNGWGFGRYRQFLLKNVEVLALIHFDRDAEAELRIEALTTSRKRNVEVLVDHLRMTAA